MDISHFDNVLLFLLLRLNMWGKQLQHACDMVAHVYSLGTLEARGSEVQTQSLLPREFKVSVDYTRLPRNMRWVGDWRSGSVVRKQGLEGRKAWWQGQESADHQTSPVRKQKGEGSCSGRSHLTWLRTRLMGWRWPHSGWVFPPQLTSSANSPIDNPHTCFLGDGEDITIKSYN